MSRALIRWVTVALLVGGAIGIGIGALVFKGGGESSVLAHLGVKGAEEAKEPTPENTAERGADDLAFSKPDPASPDWREAAKVVRAYYAAGAAENGARGCHLLYSLFAEESRKSTVSPQGRRRCAPEPALK